MNLIKRTIDIQDKLKKGPCYNDKRVHMKENQKQNKKLFGNTVTDSDCLYYYQLLVKHLVYY